MPVGENALTFVHRQVISQPLLLRGTEAASTHMPAI